MLALIITATIAISPQPPSPGPRAPALEYITPYAEKAYTKKSYSKRVPDKKSRSPEMRGNKAFDRSMPVVYQDIEISAEDISHWFEWWLSRCNGDMRVGCSPDIGLRVACTPNTGKMPTLPPPDPSRVEARIEARTEAHTERGAQ